MGVKKVYFDEDGHDKWFVGHHKYMNDHVIKAPTFNQAVQLFETYVTFECSDDTYSSDITGVEEIDERAARELGCEFYICEE